MLSYCTRKARRGSPGRDDKDRQGRGLPKRRASDVAVGLGGRHSLPPSPGVVEPVSRTCRRESPAWGDPGFLVLSAPRRRKHQAWGHVACSVHVRQAPRAARAAHSSAQVGTTRCPWRTEDTHHVVILTWDGTWPRKRHSPTCAQPHTRCHRPRSATPLTSEWARQTHRGQCRGVAATDWEVTERGL